MDKPKNINEYIAAFPEEAQKLLQQVRTAVHNTAPEAEETISYGIPAFKLNGILVYFAAFKSHIGLYALPSGNAVFQQELSTYKTGKGSIQFPFDKPMPIDLIIKIVKFRIEENHKKAELRNNECGTIRNKKTLFIREDEKGKP